MGASMVDVVALAVARGSGHWIEAIPMGPSSAAPSTGS